MVVAQLVEWSLPIPEVSGSNPVIGKIYIDHLCTVSCIEKTKIKKNGPGNGQLLKKRSQPVCPDYFSTFAIFKQPDWLKI